MHRCRLLALLVFTFLLLFPLAEANAQTFKFTPGAFYGTQGNTIVSYDTSGAQLGSLTISGVSDLRGVAFGPDGLLYVVNVNGGGFQVHAIDDSGQVHQTYNNGSWIGGNISWGKIAFDQQGYFYVGTLPGLIRFTAGDPLSATIVPNTEGPFGIYAVDALPSGNLLVADSYTITEITHDGAVVRQFASLTDIRGVVFDPATNQVFATELGNSGTGYFRLLRYDYTTAGQTGATNFWYGDDIVLASDGRLVVGSRTQAPGIYDKNLNLLGSFAGNPTMFLTQLKPVPVHPLVCDFNGDGALDLVWQNNSTGDAVSWYMKAAQWPGKYGYLDKGESTDWKIAGVADLNGDGKADLIWLNQKSGDVYYWLMNGMKRTSSGYIARGNALDWKIVSTADLDGDGKPDLIWHNLKTGDVYYWLMNGTHITSSGYIAHGVGSEWRVVGSTDLDGDGKTDLVWQSTVTGDVLYWPMDGTQFTGNWYYITRNVGVEWKVVSVADYTGDGKADLIWQNAKSGDVVCWPLNGPQWVGKYSYVARNIPTDWSIVGPR
jgi:hypothetical protein